MSFPTRPPRETIINEFACRIPLPGPRILAYRALGVRFVDHATASIMMHTEVHSPGKIEIGAHTVIGRHCLLDGRGGLTIHENVNISSFSRLITASHDPASPMFEGYEKPIEVQRHAWIASAAIILPGVTIGQGAVVAAGAVVSRDVMPYTIVGGVPARHIGDRSQDLRYQLKYRRDWM
ncbi:MAG: hypothetical protein QOE11_3652 [Solirubrobacteraceae bacterium]|jgi:maltose O-acetyltransferase|nr:hypothetical protein [Solirubrobacteraceae bacterium]